MSASSPEQRELERRARNAARIAEQARTLLIRRLRWLSLMPMVLISDQLTKWYVMEHIMRPLHPTGQNPHGFFEWYWGAPSYVPFAGIKITSFFNLVMAWNTGISFSLFNDNGFYGALFLILVALGITGLFAVWFWKTKDRLHALCFAAIMGGALGNVMDRMRFGAVIDFLDFHIYGHHWPAFNIADSAVVVGVTLVIGVSLYQDLKRKKKWKNKKIVWRKGPGA